MIVAFTTKVRFSPKYTLDGALTPFGLPRDHTVGSKIYWVYCDYSLLEAPWSTLLAMLDLLIYMFIIQPSPAPIPRD